MTDFDFQPRLAESGLSLRPLRAQDWDALHAVGSDAQIWEHHPARDRWMAPNFRRYFDDMLSSGGAVLVSDTRTGAVIGASRFDRSRAGVGEIEIGWTFLARDRWGGRTNAILKRLMIGHVLRRCDRAIFLVGGDNARSRRAVEKIGGTLTDRLHMAEVAGKPVEHVVYAVDREAFARGPLRVAVADAHGRRSDLAP